MIPPHEFEGASAGGPMDGPALHLMIATLADRPPEWEPPTIRFSFRKSTLLCIYDESHDRMRVIRPVTRYTAVSDAQKDAILEANFHTALDARYAVSNGVLYAVFIHPLSSL